MKELGLLTQKEYENQFRVYNAAALQMFSVRSFILWLNL